ncbi:MAG: hypothetical protein DRJ10_19915 [Bacteroidetes bacterium]|nr:MAG: hypothetical protein DRJ10_19915 [Bacteroidota bacterium]
MFSSCSGFAIQNLIPKGFVIRLNLIDAYGITNPGILLSGCTSPTFHSGGNQRELQYLFKH